MKKNHYLLIVLLFLSIPRMWAQESIWNGNIPSPASTNTFEGKGTAEEPYLIKTAADLAQLAANVNSGLKYGIAGADATLNFKLITDINLANKNWVGIGDVDKPFFSNFDGNNHTIRNMKISGDPSNIQNTGIGFFGKTQSAIIKNLCIDGANVIVENGCQVAVLVGQAQLGAINHCSVINSSVEIKNGVSGQHALFIGRNQNCSITDSYVASSTLKHIAQTSGGFVGSSNVNPTYKNCYVLDVTLSGTKGYTGIFCGTNNANGSHMTTLNNCYVQKVDGYSYVGTLTPATITIKEGGETKTAQQMEKGKPFFANPEAAWKLNTISNTTTNSKVWSHDGTKPVFADATHGATVKAGQINGTTQAYANGNNVLATDFNYIAFDTTNSEINDYSALEISSTNPNALIYLPADATLDKNNVIIGEQCANLVLTDGNDFVCPTAFTAAKAEYTRNCYTDGGWETIILPFAVEDIQSENTSVKNDYTIEEYKETTGADNTKTIKFGTLTSWVAGKAYILKCNNATSGTQACTFLTNTSAAIAATPTDADFKGTYALVSHDNAKGNYILNSEGTTFNKIGTAEASIPAFRAYLKGTEPSKTIRYSVIHGDGGATNIEAQPAAATIYATDGTIIVRSDKAQTLHIYSIDGRKVQSLFAGEGTTTVRGLARGIYMVNNQKAIIK